MNMQNLGDALDTLSEAYWHIELIAIACRHDPGSDAKAFAAVTHTALEKLETAKGQLEELWRFQKKGAQGLAPKADQACGAAVGAFLSAEQETHWLIIHLDD